MNANLALPPKRTLVLIAILFMLASLGSIFRFLPQKVSLLPSPTPSSSSQLPIIAPPQPVNLPQISPPSTITIAIPQNQLPLIPPQLPTYIYKTTPPENWDQQLASQLGFNVSPTIYNQLKIWQQGNQSLTMNTTSFSVSYTQPLPSHLKSLDPDQLESFTADLISKLQAFPLKDSKLQLSYYTSGTGQESLQSSSQSQAKIAKISLIPQLNQVPLFIIANSSGSTEITFNTLQNTINLNSQSFYLSFHRQQDYPIIPLDQIIAQLRLSPESATIINLSDPNRPPLLPLPDLKPQAATITTIKLAYLLDNSQSGQLIQPIYLFSGTATTLTNSNLSISLYLPAIDPKYLLAP